MTLRGVSCTDFLSCAFSKEMSIRSFFFGIGVREYQGVVHFFTHVPVIPACCAHDLDRSSDIVPTMPLDVVVSRCSHL